MTAPKLRVVGEPGEADTDPGFFLIVADHEHGFFCIEGPMIGDRSWQDGARQARNNGREIVCGPAGPDRDALAADFRRTHKFAGVPPGTILRGHR